MDFSKLLVIQIKPFAHESIRCVAPIQFIRFFPSPWLNKNYFRAKGDVYVKPIDFLRIISPKDSEELGIFFILNYINVARAG